MNEKKYDYKYFLNSFNPETDGLVKLALQNIQDSGLSPKILEQAQVRLFSGNTDTLKKHLGFAKNDGQSIIQAHRLIEFPYFDDKGGITRFEYKPFPAIYFKGDEKPRNYLQAKGQPATPYILSDVWVIREKANKPLWITEGVKKCLSLIQQGRRPIGLSGVWNFKPGKAAKKGDSEDKGSSFPLWQHFEAFQWKGRTVFIGFDSDLWVNPSVRYALYELAFKLYGRGAVVKFPLWTGGKGIDDHLAGQNEPGEALQQIEDNAKALDAFLTYEHQEEILRAISETTMGMDNVLRDNLVALIAKAFNRKPKEIQGIINSRIQKDYRETVENLVESYFVDGDGCLCRWQQKREGVSSSVRIANFTARITEEVSEDNGQEIMRKFNIEGGTKDKRFSIAPVLTTQFAGLNWVINHWGNNAIVETGQNTKDYMRHFIQVYSNLKGINNKVVYTHTGWRKIEGGEWVYLTANGAVGANGNKNKITVSLPGELLELGRYCLPPVPENETAAITTSLSFLNIGKPEITFPSCAFLFLSPLCSLLDPIPNFSGYFSGETGTFKSTVATLLLSHYGNFSIRALSNFDSTANQIEKRAFTLKDTLMVLDDYYPSSRQKDAQTKESIAQRMIRNYSNRTGRERLNADSTEKRAYSPRGLLIITGEELVQLQSTLARIMVIEFSNGDVDTDKLTGLQAKADVLPHAMASYILWIKDNIDTIQASFKTEFPRLRSEAVIEKIHRKLPEQIAYLQFSLNTLLRWAHEKGAIDEKNKSFLSQYGWAIFCKVAQKHGERIQQDDPVILFFDVMRSLLVQGKVRVEHKDLGYESFFGGQSGELIGWYDDDFYYLMPVVAWHTLNAFMRIEGGYFPFSKSTLYNTLEKRGYIAGGKDGRHAIPVRIKGELRKVLKIYKKNKILEVCTNGAEDDSQ